MRRRVFAAVVAFSVVCAGSLPRGQSADKFKARLSWVPIDATLAPLIAGSGSATAELAASKLTITGTFQGLHSPATIAQLHDSVKTGVRGPVIANLTVTAATSGNVTGSLQLTPTQLDDFKKGRLYIQIHSEKAPEGNLWGWLLP